MLIKSTQQNENSNSGENNLREVRLIFVFSNLPFLFKGLFTYWYRKENPATPDTK